MCWNRFNTAGKKTSDEAIDDPIKCYLDKKLLRSTDRKVLEKRVHSKCWHMEKERLIRVGETAKPIGELASKYARINVERWRVKRAELLG